MSKIKLLRVLDILKRTDENNPLNATQICDKLKQYGIDAERKSVCRDINLLIDYGYEIIACEDNKKGFYLAEREFEDWELKILLDAVLQAKFLTESATKKIAEKIISFASLDSQKMLNKVAPIKSSTKTKNTDTKLNIDKILRAIKGNKKIEFQYLYLSSDLKPTLKRDGHIYTVNPYKLVWHGQWYYLIGNYDTHDNLSFYRLDRMKNLSICDMSAKNADEILGVNSSLKLGEYINGAIYHYGGENIRLVIETNESMIDKLYDTFGDDLKLSIKDGIYSITIKTQNSKGLIYWLMQYCENVKVISPQSVIDELVKSLKLGINKYN